MSYMTFFLIQFNMNLIAHRGYTNKNIKENTLEAFGNAINSGFIGFECDVRLTKDKVPVICHDPFIDRTSDGKGLIRNLTYKQLLKYNFGNISKPSKIPTLTEVLKYNCIKVIELKTYIPLKKYIKLIDDKTYFISFSFSIIKRIKKEYPNLKIGLLTTFKPNKKYNYNLICILDEFAKEENINFYLKKKVDIFIYGIVGKINIKNPNVFYITDKKY